MTGVGRSAQEANWTWRRRVAVVLVLTSVLLVPLTRVPATAAAAATPAGTASTTSYYEQGASSSALYLQGETAGLAGSRGLVVLDFGRPASDGTNDGTEGYASKFLSFAAIANAVENYITGYYAHAPAYTTLDVAVGTNNSCGLYQPCGAIVCGCPDEPANYITWGQELGVKVKQLGAWSRRYASTNGFTDTVRVVAADDVEPAFDPGYRNTYDVMQGYAQAVGGSSPPMVDYGSADPGFWSEDQLLQVADSFPPNVAMPEIYDANQIGQWANLVSYAKAQYGKAVTVFGVMTAAAGTVSAHDAVAQTLDALAPITGQDNVSWLSAITP
jgi:hypothetical protein